tara:strand:+ start:280 stop:651 length:372 start_codon:yes stop_codon:yes gene_type:complete
MEKNTPSSRRTKMKNAKHDFVEPPLPGHDFKVEPFASDYVMRAAMSVGSELNREYPSATVKGTFTVCPLSRERGIRINYYDGNDPNQNYSYHYDWSFVEVRYAVTVESYDDFSVIVLDNREVA